MTEKVMYVCGLSMEMELAEEMGWVGKCIGCLYLEDNYCRKKDEILGEDEIFGEGIVDCEDWFVDYR